MSQRQGSIIPALAIAVLVVGACVALALDQIWLGAAFREVQTAAEAGALAGAARLADDDTLRTDLNVELRAQSVRDEASQAAMVNRAAGRTVIVNAEPDGDVRLGQIVMNAESGEPQFLETDQTATSVLVTARCDKRHGNPISLFFPFVTGQPTANVLARAEATVNNQVLGVRPLDTATAPVWPIGVLEKHIDPRRQDTWMSQIEAHGGPDRYGFDPLTGEVTENADGLPEITLYAPHDEDDDDRPANMSLVDLGTGLQWDGLGRQFKQGLAWQDLQDFGSELQLGNGLEQLFSSTTDYPEEIEEILPDLVGQARIILLYREVTLDQGEPAGHVIATRFAGGRIMSVNATGNGTEIILQPAVITTRTALAVDHNTAQQSAAITPNPYLYRLSLTY